MAAIETSSVHPRCLPGAQALGGFLLLYQAINRDLDWMWRYRPAYIWMSATAASLAPLQHWSHLLVHPCERHSAKLLTGTQSLEPLPLVAQFALVRSWSGHETQPLDAG